MNEARQPIIGAQAQLSTVKPSQGMSMEFLLYETEGGCTPFGRFVEHLQWPSQVLMAELVPTNKQNINVHEKNLLGEGRTDSVQVLGKRTTDEDRLIELNKVAHGLPTKKGGSDAT